MITKETTGFNPDEPNREQSPPAGGPVCAPPFNSSALFAENENDALGATKDSEGLTEILTRLETTSPKDLSLTKADRLGSLIETLSDSSAGWRPEDLSAILAHQLSAPMMFDFCATITNWISAEEELSKSPDKFPKSFSDLFKHITPSRRLLQLTKDFAKANWNHPASALPPEVTLVLYYVSIAVAFIRHNEMITRLAKPGLQTGFTWVTMQPWVDEDTKEICREALKKLETPAVTQ